jgi:hypothetical protein
MCRNEHRPLRLLTWGSVLLRDCGEERVGLDRLVNGLETDVERRNQHTRRYGHVSGWIPAVRARSQPGPAVTITLGTWQHEYFTIHFTGAGPCLPRHHVAQGVRVTSPRGSGGHIVDERLDLCAVPLPVPVGIDPYARTEDVSRQRSDWLSLAPAHARVSRSWFETSASAPHSGTPVAPPLALRRQRPEDSSTLPSRMESGRSQPPANVAHGGIQTEGRLRRSRGRTTLSPQRGDCIGDVSITPAAGASLFLCHGCDHRGAAAGAIAFLESDRPDSRRAGDAYGDLCEVAFRVSTTSTNWPFGGPAQSLCEVRHRRQRRRGRSVTIGVGAPCVAVRKQLAPRGRTAQACAGSSGSVQRDCRAASRPSARGRGALADPLGAALLPHSLRR